MFAACPFILQSTYMKVYGSEIRLVVYVIGIYSVFIYWGYLQEKLISTPYTIDSNEGINRLGGPQGENLKWSFPFALNLCMAVMCSIVSSLLEIMRPSEKSNVPAIAFWKAALSAAIASPIGYEALKYITYPMMILTKSSKPVPVMFVGSVFFRRKYTWYKYTGVALVCIGITLFTLYKSTSKHITASSQSVWSILFGIFLVLFNLSLDGYTNNEQDEIFVRYKTTSLDMMKYVNIWQTLYISLYLLSGWLLFGSSSELYGSLKVVSNCSGARFDIFMFCFCAAIGQVLLFTLIKEFGSLLWVTVSVTRKLFTVLASVLIFEHSVNIYQWLGIFFVFCGLMLEIIMSHINRETKGAVKKEQ